MDGQIDYSTYSRSELIEAATRIDEIKYPLNAQALKVELSKRPREGSGHPQIELTRADAQDLLKGMPILGWVQVAAATALSVAFVKMLPALSQNIFAAVTAILIIAINLVAGILLIRRQSSGLLLSLINYSLQAPSLSLGALSYKYTGLAGLWVGWLYRSPRIGLTASFEFGPTFRAWYGGATYQQFLSVDLLALGFVALLIAAMSAARKMKNG